MAHQFHPAAYGAEAEDVLALDQNGERLMPLAGGTCSSEEARRRLALASAQRLFPASRSPEGAFSGLYLYFSCYDECHTLCQDLETPEGSFWHGILHRQEPDPSNAAYWFRRVGEHPVFVPLLAAAAEIGDQWKAPLQLKAKWDPLAFIDFCEEARRQPGSEIEKAALEIQRAEWQILFDYCARPKQK